MNKKISIFLSFLFSVSILAGCIGPEVGAEVDEIALCTEGNIPEWYVGCTLPGFDLIDQNGTHWNESSANESGRWVAYFSASWCTHCKPTIEALDESIMENHLLVFNKHESNESSNMTKWHLTMEEELNRSIHRPFLHAPSLAANLSVTSIPHVLLIENNTVLSARIGLWDSAHEMSMWFNATSPQSGYTQSMSMDQME
tara:strand:+ start:1683 stop:2279 length:597 start_codon:yes stop_codon:yes gene_type:complete